MSDPRSKVGLYDKRNNSNDNNDNKRNQPTAGQHVRRCLANRNWLRNTAARGLNEFWICRLFRYQA